MPTSAILFLASFTVPFDTGNGAGSLLWILPLLAAVAIVYKALKVPVITPIKFSREVIILFGTILIFMIIIAMTLYATGLFVLS